MTPRVSPGAFDEETELVGTAGIAETAVVASGRSVAELRAEVRANRHVRDERFRDNFDLLLIWALWASAAGIAAMALVWALHMCGLRWLDANAFDKLQSFVLGGVITGVLGRQLEKRVR